MSNTADLKDNDWARIAFEYLKGWEGYDPQSDPTQEEITNHTVLCEDPESCWICSMRDCPRHDPMHYHHDGCTSRCDEGTTEEKTNMSAQLATNDDLQVNNLETTQIDDDDITGPLSLFS